MNLFADVFETIDAIAGITTSISFNNVTETFSYSFTDLGGVSRTGVLDVIKVSPASSSNVCTTTSTSASATLLCQYNTTEDTGTYVAKGFIIESGYKILTATKEVSTGIASEFKGVWGTQGIFFTILVAGALGGLGSIVSPAVGITMFMVGIVVASFMGMSPITMVTLVFFLILMVVIIFRMKR